VTPSGDTADGEDVPLADSADAVPSCAPCWFYDAASGALLVSLPGETSSVAVW
jgi:hypothetical protein